MTVSYSHPSSLWHVPTKWEYDWWEFAGRPWSSSSSTFSTTANVARMLFDYSSERAIAIVWQSGAGEAAVGTADKDGRGLFLFFYFVQICSTWNVSFAQVPAGWKEKIATIEMNSVKASINEDRKTWELSNTTVAMKMMMTAASQQIPTRWESNF